MFAFVNKKSAGITYYAYVNNDDPTDLSGASSLINRKFTEGVGWS